MLLKMEFHKKWNVFKILEKRKTLNHPKKNFIEQFEICHQEITHIK